MQYNLLPPESEVTEEELRMLGLNPEELFEQRNIHDSYYSTSSNYDDVYYMPYNNAFIDNADESEVDDDDYDVEVDDIDDIMQDIDFGYRSNSNFPVVLANPLSGYSGSHEFEIEYPVTTDDDDDAEEDDDGDVEDDDGAVEEEDDDDDDDSGEEDNGGCVLNNYGPYEYGINHSWAVSSSDEEREIVHTSSPMDSEQSGHSWNVSANDMVDDNDGTSSSYSEDSTDSSQSGISYLNDSNSSASTCSSSSSSSF